MKKNVMLGMGVVLLVAGIFSIAYGMGFFGFSAKRIAAILPEGKVGGQVGVFKGFLPFSVVVPGATYEWKVVVKNTGDVDWNHHTVVVTLEQDGSRVDITKWGFGWREDTTWNAGDCEGGTASSCTFPTTTHSLSSGSSKTYHIKLTIPSDAYGSYTLKVILNAVVGSTHYSNIASKTDTLTIGTVSGEITLTFIGALSMIGGVASIIAGIKKP